MFFLAGQAATSALDLIATLQQTLAGKNSSTPSTPPANGQGFDVGAGGAGGSTAASGSGTTGTPTLAPTTMDALLVAQGSNQTPIVNGDAFSQQLFSLLDGNGDGSISQAEFEAAIGQNGNTSKADAIFAQIDTNHDGSISPNELTAALSGQDGQAGGTQGTHHHHHHHGMGGMSGANSSSGSGDPNDPFSTSASSSSGASSDPFAGDQSQTVTNSDGSTTTTITYADGSQVTMTIPGASGTGSSPGTLAHNFIERMIQQQAQMMSAPSVGQSLAVTA